MYSMWVGRMEREEWDVYGKGICNSEQIRLDSLNICMIDCLMSDHVKFVSRGSLLEKTYGISDMDITPPM